MKILKKPISQEELDRSLGQYCKYGDSKGIILCDCIFTNLNFKITYWSNANFFNSEFSNIEMSRVIFSKCNFDRVIFKNIKFEDCLFYGCSFNKAKFIKTSFDKTQINSLKASLVEIDETTINTISIYEGDNAHLLASMDMSKVPDDVIHPIVNLLNSEGHVFTLLKNISLPGHIIHKVVRDSVNPHIHSIAIDNKNIYEITLKYLKKIGKNHIKLKADEKLKEIRRDINLSILRQIHVERENQYKKWGEQNYKPVEWIGILTEEVGEVAKEATDYFLSKEPSDSPEQIERLDNYRKELIQVAAVAVQMIDCLDRNRKKY